jgi:outer membrane protein assembly factor BamE (lipoprotein component of BamABCDE complex)
MKKLGMLTLALSMMLSACTYTSNVNVGKNFSKEQAAQIVKGKTTEGELIVLLGEPQMKSVLNETDVKWVYYYTDGTASAQAFTMKTTSDMTTHMLDILIRNGVVLNLAETHSPINVNMNTATSVN